MRASPPPNAARKSSHNDFPGRLIRLDVGSTKNDDGRVVRMTNEVFELLSAFRQTRLSAKFSTETQ
jgi:hypothetical protein